MRRVNTGSLEETIKDELDSYPTRYANVSCHCRVAVRLAVRLKRRRDRALGNAVKTIHKRRSICTYGFSVCPFNHELVLQYHQVAFVLVELHERLETSAQGVEQVAIADLSLVRREGPDPLQPRYDASALLFVGELAKLLRPRDEGPMRSGQATLGEYY